MNHKTREYSGLRRGNTIILVAAILTLLAIIATAYISRTQAGRQMSAATLQTEMRQDNANIIADELALETAEALFPRPIDPTGYPGLDFPNSNIRRFPLSPTSLRYEIDPTDFGPDRLPFTGDENNQPDFPWNFPPYRVVPFANWPDEISLIPVGGDIYAGQGCDPNDWPPGPGNSASPSHPILATEYNPIGNPGFGDFRLLRDLEPQRWDSGTPTGGTSWSDTLDGVYDAYSHWKHMTYIARADNGWRLVSDISDIGDFDGNGLGQLVTDMMIPVEQWLVRPSTASQLTGNGMYVAAQFWPAWRAWFGITDGIGFDGLAGYQSVYADPDGSSVPPNFISLRDPDGDGEIHEPGERPTDEFVVGAMRWQVCRVLADTDGDGFTDSFWFLSPTPLQNGARQIVAISVVDNCGMINANVVQRFMRGGNNPNAHLVKTTGWTPTDIALVGGMTMTTPISAGNWNVGFFDNSDHWFRPDEFGQWPLNGLSSSYYDNGFFNWDDLQREVGMVTLPNPPPQPAIEFPTILERLDYWRKSASKPLAVDVQSKYSPFSLENEIELRMNAGQNYPWILSRYESTLQSANSSFLRVATSREESTEYLNQLSNRDQMRDSRHRMTLFNSARNEQMPQWLWVWPVGLDFNDDGTV
ncbi:MAG: hypothetical protein L0Y44_15655, partial [Phycisphaerales bacterium]|nr:hypothetical protein [Phycisphaerales bacterium]